MTKNGCQLTLTPYLLVIYGHAFYPFHPLLTYDSCHGVDNYHPSCHTLNGSYDLYVCSQSEHPLVDAYPSHHTYVVAKYCSRNSGEQEAV